MLDNHTVTEGAKLYSLATTDECHAWDSYILNHPLGSVFHLSQWQKMIQSTFNHRPLHLVMKGITGEIAGIVPLFLVRSRIFGRMLVSSPQAAYGGILSDSQPISDSLLVAAKEMARREAVQFLELRNHHFSFEDPQMVNKDLYVTFRQEIFEDPENNFLSIPRKTRAECREGIKNGLEFGVKKIGVDGFYRIYSQSVRDLGTPVFSKSLFANGLREFGDQCKIFSVHYQGKPVAAVWTLFYKDEVIPYYGGSLREYNRLAVNNFMYWMLIRYGCENGYKVFDFGRSKKGTGSFDFKKRWGMVMTDLPYQYFLVRQKALPDTSPLNPRFSLGIRCWQKLPLPIANTIGPLIANHLI